jgi:hypothetical protein
VPGRDLADRLYERLHDDGEFRLASRYWTGTLRFDVGDDTVQLELADGRLTGVGESPAEQPLAAGHLGFSGPADVWDLVLAPVPPPFHNDVVPAQAFGIRQTGEPETFWQYYPAVRRAVEILREVR